MTTTLNLPPDNEQAFIGEATARGLTPDEVVGQGILTHTARHADTALELPSAELRMANGVPVLHTDQIMGLSVISDTIDLVRQERDLHNLGR